MSKKLNVAFMGTPDIATSCVRFLAENPHVNLEYVISMPDRPFGRKQELKSPEVIVTAKEYGVKTIQTENINKDQESLDLLINAKIDYIIVFAFAQFLSLKVLNLPKSGCFNIHTSLLPKYRGAAPIQAAILNGDKLTGVSIQKMVKKMDAGDIVISNEIAIDAQDTGGSLYEKLKGLSVDALEQFIDQAKDDQLNFSKQDESAVSFAPTLQRDDGKLDFKNSNYINLERKVRAFTPWPGTFCTINDLRLKVFTVEKSAIKLPPGEIDTQYGHLLIGTLSETIRLKEIQLAGKKRTTDTNYLNGIKEKLVLTS